MTTPLQRLGAMVQARRRDLGLYTVVDAARRADLSRDTWAKVEAGEHAKPVTYRKLEEALMWGAGSVESVLAGGEPDAWPTGREPARSAGIPDRDQIRDALRRFRQAADDLERLLDEH